MRETLLPFGIKPMEILAIHERFVAANDRPTGIEPVVAKRRKKHFTTHLTCLTSPLDAW